MAHFERYVCKNEDVFPGRPPSEARRIIGEHAVPRGGAAAPVCGSGGGAVPPQITSGEGAPLLLFYARAVSFFDIFVSCIPPNG